MTRPSFLDLHHRGELARRAERALEHLADCHLCPHRCAVDRTVDELGVCGVGRAAQVASYNLHYGEETPLVGAGGSGTIFFSGCNLRCHFCQNDDISSRTDRAFEVPPQKLARIMVDLQRRGAENVNLVTPSHLVAQILEALPLAVDLGLELPLVYNSSGYDSVEALELLDGVVDIYMPDAKITAPEVAAALTDGPDYPDRAREAIAEMHRQVGDLELDDRGVARRGLLVRHLVMPGGASGTEAWMSFLAGLSPATYVNIMGQYRPCGRVRQLSSSFRELQRPVDDREMDEAFAAAAGAGITRLDERRRPGAHLLFRMLQHEDDSTGSR